MMPLSYRMDIRHLRYFMAVATERNFTRAASRIGVAQPSLSRQIRELEDELGLRLFVRESRPVTLTVGGQLLLEHAYKVIGSVEQLRTALKRFAAGEKQRFMIGFVGSTIYGLVPALIRRFRERAPDLNIDLVEMNTITQMSALKEGVIDAGLGRLTFDDPALRRRVIEHERLVVALPVGHVLSDRTDPVSLAEISSETVILYPSEPRPSFADQIMAIFRDYGFAPTGMREVKELQTALGLVAAQFGLCLVPASVQRLRRDDIVYHAIAEEAAISPIILNWRVSDTSPATILLSQICAELAPHD
jgi:DNA-binding transcriptional LysR family regulator